MKAAILGYVAALGSATQAQSFDAVDRAVRAGIDRGVYPAAVVVIGRRDTVLYAKGYGHLTWRRSSPAPRPDSTLWDVASLTKVVATTSAVMLLSDRGRISLDAPVVTYLRHFSGPRKSEVTVRMLLDHTSGMPSYREYYRRTKSRARAVELLYAEQLDRAPGDSAVYSDLNAMLLGLMVEQITGERLDVFVSREIFARLSMSQTLYRPPPSVHHRCAPTGLWRGRPSRGRVYDRNAGLLGGVAGHAGVFSTGLDLARYAQIWLREGTLAGRPLVHPATVRRFLTRGPKSGSRLLGWDTPDPTLEQPSVFGSLLSSSAYGHTGWTGTEIWIDPARDLFMIFLTNRSFAPKHRRSIDELREVRAQLADAVVRSVPEACRMVLTTNC